jgi:predicted DsbA family dithiol-disulfide isomerase
LEQLFAGRLDINQIMIRLKAAAREAGLPFAEQRKMTYNSRLAQELAKWAETKAKGDLFHQTVFQAYFVEGLNIGKVTALLELVNRLGLPVDEARSALQERYYKAAVDSDWIRSRELGIQAVPTLVLTGQALVGAHPYEKMAALVESTGFQKK